MSAFPKKEFRINYKGSFQGHYVLGNTKKEAVARFRLLSGSDESIDVHEWKTTPKGKVYPSKLTPYAKKKMGLVS
jgi:hypothetical protein